MIVTLLLLPILVSANPFHKYPYVFLLDIGNEELEKVNSEQIRLSSPGGSVALRYPAVGDGDDITHVRVSGVDFGTDLNANIVNGGPGYKYVVIVLMGNPGVAFDAVITIQTVPGETQTVEQDSINNKNRDDENVVQVAENDPNDSAEDLTDPEESINDVNVKNGEITQESADVYSYAQNEALSGYGDDEANDESYNGSESNDVYQPYSDDAEQRDNIGQEFYEDPSINQRSIENSQSDRQVIVDQNLYNKYITLKDHLYDGSEVYSQSEETIPSYDQSEYERSDVYDEYEENDENEKLRDSNNNFIDNDGTSAVEQ